MAGILLSRVLLKQEFYGILKRLMHLKGTETDTGLDGQQRVNDIHNTIAVYVAVANITGSSGTVIASILSSSIFCATVISSQARSFKHANSLYFLRHYHTYVF
jgi:hypothetical protein